MKNNLLDLINDLKAEDEAARLKAAKKLLKTLDQNNSDEDWDYAFQRLLKGLGGINARLGFSVALAELLTTRASKISVSEYLRKCEYYFKIHKSAKGQEERGLNFGKLFAIDCLVKSPIIHNCSDEEFSRVVETVLELATKKVWFRESCFAVLCDLFDSSNLRQLEKTEFNVDHAVESTLRQVHEKHLTFTAEGVALYLTLGTSRTRSVEINGGWKENDPLARGNLATLSKSLKEVAVSGEQEKGSWKPGLNFVWGKLMQELLLSTSEEEEEQEEMPKSKKQKKDKKSSSKSKSKSNNSDSNRVSLEEFWKVVVDEGFFAQSASNERKFWGFEVFALFVQHTSAFEPLFSTNFMRSLMNHLSQSDRLLNKAAKRVLGTVTTTVAQSKPHAAGVFIKVLLKVAPNFDQKTKTKTFDTLLSSAPIEDLPSIVEQFISIVLDPSKGEDKPDYRRQWALDHLLAMIKHRGSASNSDRWIEKIVDFVAEITFFESNLSENIAAICQQRLNSIMSVLVNLERQDQRSWPYYTISKVLEMESGKNGEKGNRKLKISFEGELLEAKNKSVTTLQKIRQRRTSSPHADSHQLRAFELLFSLVILQVYSADTDAAMMLEELQTCYLKIVGRDNSREGDSDDQMDASQVLTEILLSFLSRKSALMRKLTETVWSSFTAQVSLESLGLLYKVLETKENLQGQNEMFDGADEEGEEEEEDDDDDEEEDDVGDADKENESDSEDDTDSEDEDGNEKDASGTADEAEKAARQKLAAALGIIPPGSDEEMQDGQVSLSESESHNTDDEESMDDEQMMALDDKISAIFREQRKALGADPASSSSSSSNQSLKKQQAKDARENIVQLKSRILDLLEIYIKNQDGSVLTVSAILPLLQLMRTTKDRPLGERAHNLIRTKLCKPKKLPEGETAELISILEQVIHNEAANSPHQAHSRACSQCALYTSKIILNNDRSANSGEVVQVYSSAMAQYVEKKSSKFVASLFTDFVNWVASTRK